MTRWSLSAIGQGCARSCSVARTTITASSESCALDVIGAKLVRDVSPAEMVWIDGDGLHSREVVKTTREALCVFEYIYFARSDSRMNGDVLQAARGRLGQILAREAPPPTTADLVIPIPPSGGPASRGYARASGLPQDDGLINLNPMPHIVGGKSLVVVDDSIVRGNTTRHVVQTLRAAGAREVHLRISAPPVRHPCHYGVDMSTRGQMIAHERRVAEIAAELACDSLAYLSLEGVYEAIRGKRERHCDACFSGRYPL
jgi:amidophosphoribosyltransferase